MKNYDVAIVGSGPAGAATAFYLAQNGVNVCIIEKETLPRYKTCGGGFVFRIFPGEKALFLLWVWTKQAVLCLTPCSGCWREFGFPFSSGKRLNVML